eukprot:COSAG02_NODE_16613_length_1070_cov_3.253347_1_plen_171_part_10
MLDSSRRPPHVTACYRNIVYILLSTETEAPTPKSPLALEHAEDIVRVHPARHAAAAATVQFVDVRALVVPLFFLRVGQDGIGLAHILEHFLRLRLLLQGDNRSQGDALSLDRVGQWAARVCVCACVFDVCRRQTLGKERPGAYLFGVPRVLVRMPLERRSTVRLFDCPLIV